ncbi:ASPH2-like protein [Mya arenaria]|uniref:ASPH2-like protein n=1 Tax=Mya arenaria TaxID=6604 RepID=A0ABY7E1L3_MYAAR|nr:ASPH2-like protein [Mya arenaria]
MLQHDKGMAIKNACLKWHHARSISNKVHAFMVGKLLWQELVAHVKYTPHTYRSRDLVLLIISVSIPLSITLRCKSCEWLLSVMNHSIDVPTFFGGFLLPGGCGDSKSLLLGLHILCMGCLPLGLLSTSFTLSTILLLGYVRYRGDEQQQPNVFYYRELQTVPVWQEIHLADCDMLENAFEDISNELLYLMRYSGGHWLRNMTPSGSWDVFPLINQGDVVQENAALCPETMTVIQALPSAMTRNVFGNVMFSVVKPGTIITEHYGPTNIRLRCHLGLNNVSPECQLTVGDHTLNWKKGKCLVFDDSFLHSVSHFGEEEDQESCNDGLLDSKKDALSAQKRFAFGERRAVLIVDLWHPALSIEERQAVDIVFASCTNL